MNFYTEEQKKHLQTLGFTQHHRWFIHDTVEIMISPLGEEFGIDCGEGLEVISTFKDCLVYITLTLNRLFEPAQISDEDFIDNIMDLAKQGNDIPFLDMIKCNKILLNLKGADNE